MMPPAAKNLFREKVPGPPKAFAILRTQSIVSKKVGKQR